MDTPKPYTEYKEQRHGTNEMYIYRTFPIDRADEELVWHRDTNSRIVHILSGEGWQFQVDDNLPEELKVGKDVYIPRGMYHRLLKGTSDLVIRIKEI